MTNARFSKIASPHDSHIVLPQITDLIRGHERQLLDWMQPLVVCHDVTLDLELITRIDAAGLAALITLYCDACKAGRRFAVANPSPHVREILELVGLDTLLLSQITEELPYFGTLLQETAA